MSSIIPLVFVVIDYFVLVENGRALEVTPADFLLLLVKAPIAAPVPKGYCPVPEAGSIDDKGHFNGIAGLFLDKAKDENNHEKGGNNKANDGLAVKRLVGHDLKVCAIARASFILAI